MSTTSNLFDKCKRMILHAHEEEINGLETKHKDLLNSKEECLVALSTTLNTLRNEILRLNKDHSEALDAIRKENEDLTEKIVHLNSENTALKCLRVEVRELKNEK